MGTQLYQGDLRRLALEVILRAVKDMRAGDDMACFWLQGPCARIWLDLAGIHPVQIERLIKNEGVGNGRRRKHKQLENL